MDPADNKIGTLAPDFKLLSGEGKPVSLAETLTKSNVILFFIREYG